MRLLVLGCMAGAGVGLAGSASQAEEALAGGGFMTSYGAFVPGGLPELATQTRFVPPAPQVDAPPPVPRSPGQPRVVRVILPSPYMNDR